MDFGLGVFEGETFCTRTPLTINKVNSDHELCSERVDKRRAVQLKAARGGKLGLVYNVKLALNRTSKIKNLMDLKASSSINNVEARTSFDLGCYSFDKDLFVSSANEFKFRISQFFSAEDIDKGKALIGDRAEMKLNGHCGLIGVRDFHQALLTCNSESYCNNLRIYCLCVVSCVASHSHQIECAIDIFTLLCCWFDFQYLKDKLTRNSVSI